MKDRKKDDKKNKNKKSKNVKPGEESEQNPDDDQNRILFHPRIEKCGDFLKSAISMIVTSTNKVCNLEDDLMPFLQKERTPNFPIDENFEWCIGAKSKIEEMI